MITLACIDRTLILLKAFSNVRILVGFYLALDDCKSHKQVNKYTIDLLLFQK
jgi:hypothetical protein